MGDVYGTPLCVRCSVRLKQLDLAHYGNLCHRCSDLPKVNQSGFIYIASPYTHDSYGVMNARHNAVEAFTAKMMQSGKIAFSPIVHCHHLSDKHSLPTDFAFWEDYCLSMLSKADVLWVLQLDGWRYSVGVQAEIAFAKQRGIPIVYEIDVDELSTGTA